MTAAVIFHNVHSEGLSDVFYTHSPAEAYSAVQISTKLAFDKTTL